MRRIICLAVLAAFCIAATAQRGLDFASKFMQKCKDDSAVQCVTVSPKMMDQLTKQTEENRSENIQQAIQKLKSARIITIKNNKCEEYYEMAEDLLKKNSQRFKHSKSYQNNDAHGAFYTRQLKNGNTVELVMLRTDTIQKKTVIVNLTGDIDEEFINSLLAKE